MKSTIASLQTITLPFGAGTGQRIVLDGVNGEIRIYDSNNNLLVLISPDGIVVYDTAGEMRMRFAAPAATSPYSLLELFTARADEIRQAFVSLTDDGSRNRLTLVPGEMSAHGSLELGLWPESSDGTKRSLLQVICQSMDAGSQRPIVDLTGASAPTNKEAHVVAYDYWFGTPGSFGGDPTKLVSLGRGETSYGENTADVTIPTTAGTYITVVENDDRPVYAGRRYRLIYSGCWDLNVGGSGFSVTDAWQLKFQRSTDSGGSWADVGGTRIITRPFVAAAQRYPVFPQVQNYDPAANATVRWRVVVAKTAGAATVTSVMETNGGTSPHFLSTEDVGEALA